MEIGVEEMQQNSFLQLKDNLSIPAIMAPMFLISNPRMVIQACKSGIIGSFPTLNARTADILEEWMREIKSELGESERANEYAPWAVNFISHRSFNKRYDEDLRLIEKYQPPIVITSLGDPSPVAKIVHEYGGFVISDVINVKFAKKAIEKGTDGLVLVSGGAGGHAGTLNPFAFIHEIREIWDGPIILSGSISKGEDILAAEVIGADFVYMGTRFLLAEESSTNESYKQMLLESTIEDIIYTQAFSGIHANYLIQSIERLGIDIKQLPKEGKIDYSTLENPNIRAWKDIWGAGHGVGYLSESQSVDKIVEELRDQYNQAILSVTRRGEFV